MAWSRRTVRGASRASCVSRQQRQHHRRTRLIRRATRISSARAVQNSSLSRRIICARLSRRHLSRRPAARPTSLAMGVPKADEAEEVQEAGRGAVTRRSCITTRGSSNCCCLEYIERTWKTRTFQRLSLRRWPASTACAAWARAKAPRAPLHDYTVIATASCKSQPYRRHRPNNLAMTRPLRRSRGTMCAATTFPKHAQPRRTASAVHPC